VIQPVGNLRYEKPVVHPAVRSVRRFFVSGLLLVFVQTVSAQLAPPDDFFHGGARLYLSNNIPGALERVTNGLALYPNDIKLKKLEELLKQQQNQHQQQQQQNQQNDQSKQDQQKNQKQDQQQSKNQNQPEKDKQQEQQKKEAQEKKDQAQQQEKKSGDQSKPEEKPEDQQAARAYAAGEMTPEQAKQLLDSQKDNELMMPVVRKEKAADQQRTIKDW